MNSTGQLLDALESALTIGNYAAVALVIAQCEGAELLFANDNTRMMRLAKLNHLVANGARPVGFIGVTAKATVSVWPLDSYRENQQVADFLDEVQRQCRGQLVQMCSVAEVYA